MPPTHKRALRLLAGIVALGLVSPPGHGQVQITLVQGGAAALIDPSDLVFHLVDHQSGLLQTVMDAPVAELRSNVVMLAKLATLMNVPAITSASEPNGTNGTNGPLMPEIYEYAPHAVHVARRSEINAWSNEDFVATVRATGRRTLVIAGVWTGVCVLLPALDVRQGVPGLCCHGCLG